MPPEKGRKTLLIEALLTRLDVLSSHKNYRGEIALLRRSLSGEVLAKIRAISVIGHYFTNDDRTNAILLLIAGLYAEHPMDQQFYTLGQTQKKLRNLGTTCRLLDPDKDRPRTSIAVRFAAFLEAEEEDIASHLRSIISIAKSHNVPVNYKELYWTLQGWSNVKKDKQYALAKEFWGAFDEAVEVGEDERTEA